MPIELEPKEWVLRYADYLFSYAFYKTNKRETAEDLVQDAFLSAFKAKDGFRGECSEKTWLTRILNRKIIDYYRASKIGIDLDAYIIDTEEAFHDAFFANNEPGRWTNPILPPAYAEPADMLLNSKEFKSTFEQCLAHIPVKLRQIFIEKYIDDKNADEICKDFKLTTSNYWVIIHRAKVLLRACLEKNQLI